MAKYCNNCGKAMDSDATFCVECGTHNTGTTKKGESNSILSSEISGNSMAFLGLILSFFVPIVGLPISIIGLKKSKELDGQGKGFAVTGIIISASRIAFVLFYFLIIIITSIFRG